MSIIDDLPRKSQPMQRLWRGTFITSPTKVSDLADVILPDFTDEFRFSGVFWSPRVFPAPAADKVDTAFAGKPLAYYLFPQANDPCLCVFDNNRILWAIAWWPYKPFGSLPQEV